MKFDTLYAKSSTGKIKQWSIEANGNTMIEKWGYVDSKIQEQRKTIKGKNIGKANETSDDKQCELECRSKWQKKVDEQYVVDRNKIKESGDQKVLLPMLALRYQDRSHDIKFPCYVQPKLNGVRCLYQNGKFMSRKGKEYTVLDHLVPELNVLNIDIPDGEIYVHGMTLQEIIRRVKKERGPKTEELQYWIYDQVNDKVFAQRITELHIRFGVLERSILVGQSRLKQVQTELVKSDEEIKKWHDKFVQDGYEGVIIRNTEGLYKVKHRSKDLQKYKEFIDKEFEIIGGHEGTGPDAGTVVFEVKTKEGQVFSVRPRGTREIRTEWYNDIKKLINKKLTVRYQNLSEDGIPIFPVGIEINATVRDYE